MDERTRAATYRDVRRIAELLEAEQVEYALIGGYALALQGIVRLTEDVGDVRGGADDVAPAGSASWQGLDFLAHARPDAPAFPGVDGPGERRLTHTIRGFGYELRDADA